MSEPISVGDLVVVTASHCKLAEWSVGKMFVARAVRTSGAHCTCCFERAHVVTAQDDLGGWYGYLKRIPPISELEGQRTDEDMKEPA